MPPPIERTLTYEDGQAGRKTVRQDEIPAFPGPVVILGDPGLGKTVLTQALGDLPGMKYIEAGRFTLKAKPESLIAAGERIVIDGLDEIASGGGVEAVLRQLSAMDDPPFVLSCREADWQGAADRIKIGHGYDAAPVLLHLLPFERDDAHAFFAQEFPGIDADALLDHLADRGIETLYGNPLTLRLLAEVAQADGQLPETPAQLFDRACRVMLKEENPYHESDSHALTHEDKLLLAAGAICAAQVLCSRIGVYTGSYGKTPDEFLNIADISGLPHGQAASDALKTRLFQAEGENRFTHIHRVIAEYLGAMWLARCFEDGVSQKRIFALFGQGDGVPTSLRGLHAWMAHFSDELAGRCIDADPYGVLRYGETEKLSVNRARGLLAALERLSEQDPYFRSGDWGRHPVSGLMRPELRDKIVAIIETTGRDTQLALLLLEALAGTALAAELSPTLEAVMFDPARDYYERASAWEALGDAGTHNDREAAIRRLLDMGDAESARLACDILGHIGARAVSYGTAVEAILAHLGFTVPRDAKRSPSVVRYMADGIFVGLDADRLAALLDGLVEFGRPKFRNVDRSSRSDFADLVRKLAVRILEADPAIQPERVWGWIGWLDGDYGYEPDAKEDLARIFRENGGLRTALLRYLLLTPCAENIRKADFRLSKIDLGLRPSAEEVEDILSDLHMDAGERRIEPEALRHLVLMGVTAEGLSDNVRTAALEIANGDSDLLSVLDRLSNTEEPEWEIEDRKRAAEREAKRQRIFQSHRDELEKDKAGIDAGEFRILFIPANVYLGRKFRFDSEALPQDRLHEFLGEQLGDQAMLGFMATLDRSDLPTASEISQARSENKQWPAEAPMICGAAEMLRRGRPLDSIDRDTLKAVYMAWRRLGPTSHALGQTDIGSELETVLFRNEAEWEEHFRTSIEPQLARNAGHVEELYRLTGEAGLADLAGRLAVDWLRGYPELRFGTQEQLLACALDNVPDEAKRALVLDSRQWCHPDYETMLLWLSGDFTVDFDNCRNVLSEAAAENADFLWRIRERVAPDGKERFARYSIDQIAYIVEGFGAQWPWTERPGSSWGVHNPWDAAEFIRDTIYAIAGRPEPEATEALQRLVAGHAPSYANTLKHALALQRKARRDFEYAAPTVGDLCAVMADAPPETIKDMRAWFGDRIAELQERIRGSDTNMWEAYWTEPGKPRGEEFCRDRLIEHVSVQLPPSIRLGPETRMPAGKRADIALTRNAVKLPMEIKGQWHEDVWDAASTQLDAKYTIDWQAEGRGVYIVLWFGDVREERKQLRPHPDGLDRPETPERLERMLIDRLPEARRPSIDVYVIDVSGPAGND